jgi:hypothetical protein
VPSNCGQAKVEKEMGSAAMVTDAEREELDSRSVYVGNVRSRRRSRRATHRCFWACRHASPVTCHL